jgi:four helix bundle protein
MKKSVLHEKSFNFAIRCTKLYRYLVDNKRDFIISKQFLRSGTAIGALIHEGKYAESKLDFIHKYAIALKECNETIYWLELLYRTDTLMMKNTQV